MRETARQAIAFARLGHTRAARYWAKQAVSYGELFIRSQNCDECCKAKCRDQER